MFLYWFIIHLLSGSQTHSNPELLSDVTVIHMKCVLSTSCLISVMQALFMHHPKKYIRDTQKYPGYKKLVGGKKPGLKMLSQKVLGVKIQSGEHSSVSNAIYYPASSLECFQVIKSGHLRLTNIVFLHMCSDVPTCNLLSWLAFGFIKNYGVFTSLWPVQEHRLSTTKYIFYDLRLARMLSIVYSTGISERIWFLPLTVRSDGETNNSVPVTHPSLLLF